MEIQFSWSHSENTIVEIQYSENTISNFFSLCLHVNVMDFRYVITFTCKGNGFHEFFYFENQFHEIFDIRRAYYAIFSGTLYIIFLVIAMVFTDW